MPRRPGEDEPFRLAVLASGRGSNLQALIDARDDGRLPVDIVLVGSDRPGCAAIGRAQAAGIATVALDRRDYADRAAMDRALFDYLAARRPDLVILAGYMRIIDAAVIDSAPWPILNIHPSLLPKYPGLDTHARALAAGDREHGASIHIATVLLDGGPVLAQVRIPVLPDDSPEQMAERLLPREHALMVAAVRLVASGRVLLSPARIQFDGARLAAPLQLDDNDELVPASH
ncbi:MAG: phosphoribosylglycinamide formyltransferase [Xanthomonadales bacterium]|nr:phosphoribosylglycinamide formyltransferase [Xanthomonadales bacterium]